MFNLTKEQAIKKCLQHLINVSLEKCKTSDMLVYDIEHIQNCLKVIIEMVNDPENVYVDITGNNIVSDMILKSNLK